MRMPLNASGASCVVPYLTTLKFTPQMRLIPNSIMSVEERAGVALGSVEPGATAPLRETMRES